MADDKLEPIAILGIGTMGHGMAASALRARIPTTVWNRNHEATRDLAQLGANVAQTAAGAARSAAIVVTMVTDADAVIAIARDEGVLTALSPGAILVQMSTIGVAGIERVAALVAAERPDVIMLDAPVSGSKDPAEHGQLTIFASGPDEVRARVTPLFDALGQRTVWAGSAGTGTRLKLVANTWLAFAAEAVASSVALAHGLGLDTDNVVDALEGNPLVSPWQEAKLQRIAKRDFSAQFALIARSQGRTPRRAGRRRPARDPCVPGGRVAGGYRSRLRPPRRDRGDAHTRREMARAIRGPPRIDSSPLKMEQPRT